MLLPALAAAVALAGLAVPAPATAAAAASPVSLTIDRLSPSSIPKSGKVMVSGWVTNESDETWADVAVYTFIAADPIPTSDDLAFESTKDPEVQVGERITVPGTY